MRLGLGIVVLVTASALSVDGQVVGGAASGPRVLPISQPSISSEFVREIDDPHTGFRWLLVRDPSHPGGPGRMVSEAELKSMESESKDRQPNSITRSSALAAEPVSAPHRPQVRAGDRLIVEEHTPVVDARLEAVALEAASAGSELKVRLKIGGKVVRATLLDRGRATLLAESEARP